MKVIEGRRGPIGSGRRPAIAVSLLGRTAAELIAEARTWADQPLEVIEWRIDAFEAAQDPHAVCQLAAQLQASAPAKAWLLTTRSRAEGGAGSLPDEAIVHVLQALADAGHGDVLDVELRWPNAATDSIVTAARRHRLPILFSVHDFTGTPSSERLAQWFDAGARRGGAAVKVAVMPQREADVDALLAGTRAAHERLPLAVVGIAMGELGARSRIEGGEWGSCLTFASGAIASAPGQWPLTKLRDALASHYDNEGR